MPFILVISGLILIVTGARNTFGAFGKQLTGDFIGPGNFTYWALSVGGIGALGYVSPLRKFSIMFMTLILLALILAHGGFFEQFMGAIKKGPVAPAAAAGGPQGSAGPLGGSSPAPATGQSTAAWLGGNAMEGAGLVGPQGQNKVSGTLDSLSNWLKW
jgi:hypothetical protein